MGLQGEGFLYPGYEDSPVTGFSRFATGSGKLLHPLRMARGVTMEECSAIVQSHRLLAPHAVWLVDMAAASEVVDALRVGDCGLFLGARSPLEAQLWRAFYRYARLILDLGHVDKFVDDDIRETVVHTTSEGECTAASAVCVWWSEFELDDEVYSCRVRPDASNIVTPAVLLASLEAAGIEYPPPVPPPPSPPVDPPLPSPPPGEHRCELSAIPSTSGRKVVDIDATGAAALVDQKCWRWDTANDWPPFVVHRDLYENEERCYGTRSRSVQWDGGFRQSLMPKDAYDPYEQNTDNCPFRGFLEAMDRTDLLYKREEETYAGDYCFDGSGTDPSIPVVCPLGTQVRSCGVHRNLVSFGLAAFTMTNGVPSKADGGEHARCVESISGKYNIRDGMYCRDGGPGSIDAFCYYGTDPVWCGTRPFNFLPEYAGPDVPDDSCATHNNSICEDGLMWSKQAPGRNECAPNTDVTDCGWRMPKRMARVGIGRESTCLTSCSEELVSANGSFTDGTEVCPGGCSDKTDYVLPPLTPAGKSRLDDSNTYSSAWCGRGTQTSACQRVSDADMLPHHSDMFGSFSRNYHFLMDPEYHERVLYVQANNIGKSSCDIPDNLFDDGDGPDVVCSDGGVGSHRVLLKTPKRKSDQTNVDLRFLHADFMCPYGSQPGVCPNRTLSTFQEVQDELEQPSGPGFPSCFDTDVPDYECCRSEHTFRITGRTGTNRSVLNQVEYAEDFCAYPCTDECEGDNCLACSKEPCPTHWTSYHHTPTGCEAYCNAAFQREGNDDTCVPAMPECVNFLDAASFPDEYLDVTTSCICGARLPTLVAAGVYVNRGTILQSSRRGLQSHATGSWTWPQSLSKPIDQYHGGHFDVDDACYRTIMDFRTQHIPVNATCSTYMDLTPSTLPDDLRIHGWSVSLTGGIDDCDNETDEGACCVTSRAAQSATMSRIWLQTTDAATVSMAEAFGHSRPVGTAVHTSLVAAVGDFDSDEFPDIVIGNRLYLSVRNTTGGAATDFAFRAGIEIGPREFSQVYAGDVNGEAPDDIVAVYDDNSVEVFLGIHNASNKALASSNGVGFHSMGVVLAAGTAIVTTVNFVGTLHGHGTNCRGRDFGCTSTQRAVFVGTLDTDDYIFVSPEQTNTYETGLASMDFTIRLMPLEGTSHKTLSSTRFYSDAEMNHQALAIGTSADTPNALAYLGFPGFAERYFATSMEGGVLEESVAVSAGRIETGVNLICFANRGAPNRCYRIGLDADMLRDNRVTNDMGSTNTTMGRRVRRRASQDNDNVVNFHDGEKLCSYSDLKPHKNADGAPMHLMDTSTLLPPLAGTSRNPTGHLSAAEGAVTTLDDCHALCDTSAGCEYITYATNCALTVKTVQTPDTFVSYANPIQCDDNFGTPGGPDGYKGLSRLCPGMNCTDQPASKCVFSEAGFVFDTVTLREVDLDGMMLRFLTATLTGLHNDTCSQDDSDYVASRLMDEVVDVTDTKDTIDQAKVSSIYGFGGQVQYNADAINNAFKTSNGCNDNDASDCQRYFSVQADVLPFSNYDWSLDNNPALVNHYSDCNGGVITNGVNVPSFYIMSCCAQITATVAIEHDDPDNNPDYGQCNLYGNVSQGDPKTRFADEHKCVSLKSTDWKQQRRECVDVGEISTFTFGDPDEDTRDIRIGFIGDDQYADITTVSGRNHIRVYRGNEHTQATGDFSSVVPETVNTETLYAVQGISPRPPPAPDSPLPSLPPPSPLLPPPPTPEPPPSPEFPPLSPTHPPQGAEPAPQPPCAVENTACEYVDCCEDFECLEEDVGNFGSVFICKNTSPSGRRLDDTEPYSRFPGGASAGVELAAAEQLFLRDFDNDGRVDIFAHSPARSPGSCAQRCHGLGRIGYDSFEVEHAAVVGQGSEPTFCYCGPHYDTMEAPSPPPSPPMPPPSPETPPSQPPVESPHAPPPLPPLPYATAISNPRTLVTPRILVVTYMQMSCSSPASLVRAVGLCTLHASYDLPPAAPSPPPTPPAPPSRPSPP